MGNWFSRANSSPAHTTRASNRPLHQPHTTSGTPQTTRPHPQPTASDVESYVLELSEVSEFLDNLDEFTSGKFVTHKVAGEALDLDDEAMNSYLAVLSMKADQLNGIRKFLLNSPDVSQADLLRDLLNNVEPKCRQVRDKLSRLRSSLVTEAASCGCDADVGETRAVGGASEPGPSGLCGSASAAAQTGSGQPGSTGPRHAGQSPMTSLTPVSSDLSIRSDEENGADSKSEDEFGDESNLEEEEEEDPGRRRSSAGQGQNTKALDDWRRLNSTSDVKRLKVDKSGDLLNQVIQWYSKMSPKTLRRIVAVTFVGERGMDMGALTREFFYIVFEAVIGGGGCKGQRFLEGQRGHLIPNAMTDCRAFASLGRLIVHAIINDCRGLPGLSPAIVQYLVGGRSLTELEDSHPPLHVDDVADPHLKQLLQKYENGEVFSASEEDAWMNWMAESSCMANWRGSIARQYVIQHLLLHYVFMKRIRQIQALEEGMKSLGLQRFLIDNGTKENISEVFPSNDSTAYSPDMVTAKTITRGDGFDPKVFELFKQFMRDLHKGNIANFRLCDLIRFATSSPYLPERLVVSFSLDITIPVAHACFSELVLPLAHQTYPKFRDAMVTAFQNGLTGFQLD